MHTRAKRGPDREAARGRRDRRRAARPRPQGISPLRRIEVVRKLEHRRVLESGLAVEIPARREDERARLSAAFRSESSSGTSWPATYARTIRSTSLVVRTLAFAAAELEAALHALPGPCRHSISAPQRRHSSTTLSITPRLYGAGRRSGGVLVRDREHLVEDRDALVDLFACDRQRRAHVHVPVRHQIEAPVEGRLGDARDRSEARRWR